MNCPVYYNLVLKIVSKKEQLYESTYFRKTLEAVLGKGFGKKYKNFTHYSQL